MSVWRVIEGDCREVLRGLPDESVQCCVTSPPYWGLRDYGHTEQIGLEDTLAEYVAKLVAVHLEVRRVLRPDGTLWLNLGDSYAGAPGGGQWINSPFFDRGAVKGGARIKRKNTATNGLKPKDLAGVPWSVALALRDSGWWLRSDIIWAKPNPMPESVADRPTKAHEYVFLLSKSEAYFYNSNAIAEPALRAGEVVEHAFNAKNSAADPGLRTRPRNTDTVGATRNARTVWTMTNEPFHGAHFATMPTRLVERCLAAGSSAGDLVLDPFTGAGTVGLVANRMGRDFVGVELNPDYARMARQRITADAPLLNASGGL